MHFIKSGEGTPVVLIHGFCEDMSIWESITPELNISCQVITIDLFGFGGSSDLNIPSSIAELALKVHQEILALGIQQYTVVGHSLGGYIVLELAKQFPDQLLGIALLHSTAYPDDNEKKKTRLKTIEFVRKRGVELFVQSFVPQLFGDKTNPGIKTVLAVAREIKQEALIAYTLMMMNRLDNSEVLKKWQKPSLFIAGERDTLVVSEVSRKHQNLLAKENYFELPKVGHMGMYEAKSDIIALLMKFTRVISN